jgi:hypothetical protein
MSRQGLEQRPPAGREFGKAERSPSGQGPSAHGRYGRSRRHDDVERSHHARRKLFEDGRFQARESGETWMVGRASGKIDARAPGFVKRVDRRVDHARKRLDALQLAHRRSGQSRLDSRTQAVVVDGPAKPPASRTAACSKDMI